MLALYSKVINFQATQLLAQGAQENQKTPAKQSFWPPPFCALQSPHACAWTPVGFLSSGVCVTRDTGLSELVWVN